MEEMLLVPMTLLRLTELVCQYPILCSCSCKKLVLWLHTTESRASGEGIASRCPRLMLDS